MSQQPGTNIVSIGGAAVEPISQVELLRQILTELRVITAILQTGLSVQDDPQSLRDAAATETAP